MTWAPHDQQLSPDTLGNVRRARHYVPVLPAGSLDSLGQESRLGRELATALAGPGCTVVAVTLDLQMPAAEQLPGAVRGVLYCSAVRWVHDYQAACLDKLERLVRGDTRVDSPISPHRSCYSGRSTPTPCLAPSPLALQKLLRTRTASTDSALGGSTSSQSP